MDKKLDNLSPQTKKTSMTLDIVALVSGVLALALGLLAEELAWVTVAGGVIAIASAAHMVWLSRVETVEGGR